MQWSIILVLPIFPYRHVVYLFQSSQVVTPLCFKTSLLIINTPKWTHISISPSIFLRTCTYTFTTLHLLHTLFRNPKTPHHHSSLLKCLKKRRRRKERGEKSKEREKSEVTRRKISENIFYLYLYLHYHLHHLPYPSPSTSLGSIIIISGSLFVFYNPLCFISMLAFSQIIPLEIVSFISFSLLTRYIQR